MKELTLTDDLREKLKAAASKEEIARLIAEAGLESDEETAAKIYTELSSLPQKNGDPVELSEDELAAVSGGDHDYMAEGCVGDYTDTFCYFNDSCEFSINFYYNYPTELHCPDCGAYLYFWDNVYEGWGIERSSRYNCYNCGGFYKGYWNCWEKLR